MKRAEDLIQKQCVQWIKYQYPELIIHHSPNGGFRTKAEAGIFKSIGTLAGFPDLLILFPDGNILFIEVKTLTGRQSASQKEFQRKAQKLGHNYEVVRSLNEFIMTINKHLKKSE